MHTGAFSPAIEAAPQQDDAAGVSFRQQQQEEQEQQQQAATIGCQSTEEKQVGNDDHCREQDTSLTVSRSNSVAPLPAGCMPHRVVQDPPPHLPCIEELQTAQAKAQDIALCNEKDASALILHAASALPACFCSALCRL